MCLAHFLIWAAYRPSRKFYEVTDCLVLSCFLGTRHGVCQENIYWEKWINLTCFISSLNSCYLVRSLPCKWSGGERQARKKAINFDCEIAQGNFVLSFPIVTWLCRKTAFTISLFRWYLRICHNLFDFPSQMSPCFRYCARQWERFTETTDMEAPRKWKSCLPS